MFCSEICCFCCKQTIFLVFQQSTCSWTLCSISASVLLRSAKSWRFESPRKYYFLPIGETNQHAQEIDKHINVPQCIRNLRKTFASWQTLLSFKLCFWEFQTGWKKFQAWATMFRKTICLTIPQKEAWSNFETNVCCEKHRYSQSADVPSFALFYALYRNYCCY